MILEDADGLVCPEDTDNDRAHKYMTRTADEQNLEASDAFFARLIEEAHKRGIRVLVDGVFNHCGSFNKWLDGTSVPARGRPSRHMSEDKVLIAISFQFHNKKMFGLFNDSYDGWWGHATLEAQLRGIAGIVPVHSGDCEKVSAPLEQMAGGWMWRQIWGGAPG